MATVAKFVVFILLAILQVATKYKTVLMSNAFPAAFLEPLLRMTLSQDAATRRIVQEILHTLLDRQNNLDKLKTVRFASSRCHPLVVYTREYRLGACEFVFKT